jgi:hypothetical protein
MYPSARHREPRLSGCCDGRRTGRGEAVVWDD